MIINHDNPGIHLDWIKQINHNQTTREAIEEEMIDCKD